MNAHTIDTTADTGHGTLIEPHTLQIGRLLPGSVERVWAYLTDSNLRRSWLAAGEMSLQEGSSFELVWRNDELSASPNERPEGIPAESRATCVLTELDPLKRLRFTWPGVGDVTMQLEPQADGVWLTVTHRGLTDRLMTLMVGAGWHMHLDILVARANNTTPGSFWEGWKRLRQDYDERLPA